MQKILFISEFWKPIIKGGGEINAHNLAKGLVEKGHNVSVLTSKPDEFTEIEEVMDGIKVYRKLDTGNTDSVIGNFKRMFIFKNSLKKHIDWINEFDIIHLIGTSSVIAKEINKPCFATIESYINLCPKGDLLCGKGVCNKKCSFIKFIKCQMKSNEIGKMKNRFYLKYNPLFWFIVYMRYKNLNNSIKYCNLISVSNFVKKRLEDIGLKSSVVPNSIEIEKFNSSNFPNWLNKKLKILYLGSLTEYKGVKVLAEAVKGLDCEAHFYGDGQLKEYIKNSENCYVNEMVPYEEIPAVYAQYDVVVFPSIWNEPFGRIAIEGMAAGKTVIGSDIGAIPEILKEGILVPPNDVNKLKEELKKHIPGSNKKYILEQYSQENVINKLLEVYNKAKIDVCIPTLKKEEEIQDCLKAIKEVIPYNRILIDDTPGGRANSRTSLLKKVETPFFFFIDDDVIVNKKWFNKVIKKIKLDNKIGAVSGLGLSDSFILNCIRHFLMLRGMWQQRGFTSNTIIRKEAIKDIELYDNQRFEDFELQNKIKEKGFKWKVIPAYCIHTKPGALVWEEAKRDFKEIWKKEGLIKAIFKI